jgi:hypothetical protein
MDDETMNPQTNDDAVATPATDENQPVEGTPSQEGAIDTEGGDETPAAL